MLVHTHGDLMARGSLKAFVLITAGMSNKRQESLRTVGGVTIVSLGSLLLHSEGQRSSLRAHYKHRECNVNPRPQLLNLLLTSPISSCHCSCLIHERRDQEWDSHLILEMKKVFFYWQKVDLNYFSEYSWRHCKITGLYWNLFNFFI